MQSRKFYKIILPALLIFSSAFAFKPDRSIPGAHVSFKTIADDEKSCIIPFNRVGNLIIIQATVDSIEGNFILDTGAPHLVLNLTYFRHYPSSVAADAEQTSIAGSTSPLLTTSVGRITFGTFEFQRMHADLVNLGNIENAKGIRILGLLGVDLFRRCEMIIDFDNNQIHLYRISRKEASKYQHAMLVDTSLYRTISFDVSDNRIIVTTEVEKKKLKFVIDCAAEASILDSRLPEKVFENFIITGKVKLTGPGNRKIDALIGNISSFRIGSHDVKNMTVTVTNLEKTCFAHAGCVDGVLGFNFLSMHKLGFNFVTRKMYIWK